MRIIKRMETETEVRVIEVNMKCVDCETAMRKTGKAPSSAWYGGDKKIEYKCPRCGTIGISDKDYPYLKYVPK